LREGRRNVLFGDKKRVTVEPTRYKERGIKNGIARFCIGTHVYNPPFIFSHGKRGEPLKVKKGEFMPQVGRGGGGESGVKQGGINICSLG